MPLLKLQTSVIVTADKKDRLLLALSKTLAGTTGKPESYVMVTLEQGSFCMAGKVVPAAFADVRGIGGLNGNVNAQISKEVCDLLKKELGIEPGNIYLNFTDVPAQNWGFNGRTFG
jgi:phenylpyruvate tautomerase PptA (4-oxalocrotonate tautomerase family)